jgi:hypothetical protein
MSSIHLRLCLPSGLFHSGFPSNNLYTFLFSPIRATCPAHLIFLDFIILIILLVIELSPPSRHSIQLLNLIWKKMDFSKETNKMDTFIKWGLTEL